MVQNQNVSNSEVVEGVCYKIEAVNTNEIKGTFQAISKASQKTLLILGDFDFPHINWETNERMQQVMILEIF
jgi:hypothetical protein